MTRSEQPGEGAFPVSLSVLCAIGLFVVGLRAGATDARPEPPAAITVPCEIIEWYDGDTPTVRVSLDARIRLLDCWAAEVHTKDLAAKARGIAARDHARHVFPVGSKGMLEIPLDGKQRFDDAITLGRVLGRVWVDGKDCSAEQVKAGHATTIKVGL